jgi:hypothetical protein
VSDVIHTTTLEVRRSVNTPDFPAPAWKADPDLSAVEGVPARYWKWDAVAERPIPMDQAERDATDAAHLDASRESEMVAVDSVESVARAMVLVLLDELNAHAAKVNSLLTAIDGAASLGALRTAVGAISDYPTRSAAQIRSAIRAKMGT